MNKEELILFSTLVWRYGDVFIDEKFEIETHIVSISFDDFLNFGFQELEVHHDKEKRISYYRIRKTN